MSPIPKHAQTGRSSNCREPASARTGNFPGYRHDPFIIFVPFEKFVAEGEETLVGEAVIFEDNTVIDLREKPGYCGTYRILTSQILLTEQGFYFTVPVDFECDVPGLFTKFLIFRAVCPGTVCSNKQTPRSCNPYLVKYSLCRIRAVEYEEQDRGGHDPNQWLYFEIAMKIANAAIMTMWILSDAVNSDRFTGCLQHTAPSPTISGLLPAIRGS